MSDCVPYALHVLSGRPFPEVVAEVSSLPPHCRWSDRGMSMLTARSVLLGWGVQTGKFSVPCRRTTLAQFVAQAEGNRDYMVSVRDHVVSIKGGVVFDKARTPGRAVVVAYVEVFQGVAMNEQQPVKQVSHV